MTVRHRRATLVANRLLSEYGIRAPAEIDVEAIALDKGLYVHYASLPGSWARLLRKGDGGIIRVSSTIESEGQRRFCIGHEIGHFLLHEAKNQIELCTSLDMLSGHGRRSEEPEANAFAGELLMPESFFRDCLAPTELTLAGLEDLSRTFSTTISATIHRVVDLAVHVCALVRSENGRTRSFHACHDFPFRIRDMGVPLDPRSCAGEFFRDGFVEEREADVPADAWLNDQRLTGSATVRELTVPMPNYAFALTLLWIVPGSELDSLAAE